MENSDCEGAFLDVGSGHSIYYEDLNPGAEPVILFLHGGPGGGVRDEERQLFSDFPGRVVMPDQRGAGHSLSIDPERDNTTGHLLADLEQLRSHLGIERWIAWGGSWGSTLALAYAETHPQRVSGLVIYGVFLCRQAEMHWFYGANGAANIYPDEYARFVAPLGDAVTLDNGCAVIKACHDAMRSGDDARDLQAAQALARWEAVNSFLSPGDEQIAPFTDPKTALTLARLETRYFVNGGYLGQDNTLLSNIHRIAEIPCQIVQGRYDTICPPRAAWDIHTALPGSRLNLVEAAHDMSEAAINAALRDILGNIAREHGLPGG